MNIQCTSVESCDPDQYCDLVMGFCTPCSILCDPYTDKQQSCKEKCAGYLATTEVVPEILHLEGTGNIDRNNAESPLIGVGIICGIIAISLMLIVIIIILLICCSTKFRQILKKILCTLRKLLLCTVKKDDESKVTGDKRNVKTESNPANEDSVSLLGRNTESDIQESVKKGTELEIPDNPSCTIYHGEGPTKQPPVNSITHSSAGRTDNVHVKSALKTIPQGQNNQTNQPVTGAATNDISPLNKSGHNKIESKSVEQRNNEQTDQGNNRPINNTCPQQIHVKSSSVQAGDTVEANSTQVEHGEEHQLEIHSFFSATQFKTPGSNLEGAAVADGVKKEKAGNVKRADSVSEIVKLKENVSDNDKQEVKQSIRPHVSVMDDSSDESEETNLKQANQHTRKEPSHNVTTEREPTNTVAKTADSRPAISLNPKPPATHPTQPQVNLQQPNVLPYPTQQAYVEPTRPVADPTTKGVLSGVKKTHPNRKIYDDLRGIDWVQGYYSEGKSIIVYADMTRLQEDVALKEITFRTGQPAGKFHLKHEAEIA